MIRLGIKGRIYGTAIFLLIVLAISSICSLFILYSIQGTNIEIGESNGELLFVYEYSAILNQFEKSFSDVARNGNAFALQQAENELRKLSYIVQLDEAQEYEEFILAYTELQHYFDQYTSYDERAPEWAAVNVISSINNTEELANAQSMKLQDYVTSVVGNAEIFITTGLQISIAIWAIVFIAGIFASTLLSRSIVLPLKQLSDAAYQLSTGDLSARAYVMRDDELGQLSLTLNSVVDQLEHSYTQLEMEVKNRTEELDKTKHNLEQIVSDRTRELEKIKHSLQQEVENRTNELEEKLKDMEKLNELMVGREMKMIELKERIQELQKNV